MMLATALAQETRMFDAVSPITVQEVIESTQLKRDVRPEQRNIEVPQDVINKFEVEQINMTPKEFIINKLRDETHEKGESFYVCDLEKVLDKYRQWTRFLPRVTPFYAIKCNPNTAIIKTLASLGVNFDCASKAEIQQILGSGVAPSRIIYANPTKMKSHIAYAKSCGVEMMTFDNSDELRKIAECYPTAKLVLRIITDDSQSICRFSTKFGAPLQVCPKLLALAKELNLNVIGISFHVGSGCMSVKSFAAAIRSAHQVFQEGEKHGFNFSFLDLGGGWPGTDDDGITFEEIANCVRPLVDELFPSHVEVIAEPGRYFVAACQTLAVSVFAKRTIESEEKNSFLYYINDGVYQSFNCIFFDHNTPTPLLLHEREESSELFPCTIFGPTCDSMDCIGKDIQMPELEVDEWLYFKNMGAYTVAAASAFNGFRSHPIMYYVQTPLVNIQNN